MSSNKLIGGLIGFLIGMLLGLQMCTSCHGGEASKFDFSFGAILGLIGAILGAIIAKEEKDK